MKKVRMNLLPDKKGRPTTLVLTYSVKESEQAIGKLILTTKNALKRKFRGVQLPDGEALAKFLQRNL